MASRSGVRDKDSKQKFVTIDVLTSHMLSPLLCHDSEPLIDIVASGGQPLSDTLGASFAPSASGMD